ncbi:voltage-dependent anion-selective channel isoform X1 [Plutella xylostella]|nr:voltage-dependent anion-selective channel isoform X1 [Plutella xylostella]
MSFYDELFRIRDVIKKYFDPPLVQAAIVKERVQCVKTDGSYGEMTICRDDETAQRIPCPAEDHDHCPWSCQISKKLTRLVGGGSYGMAPPFYADLGKKANDVFSKGYHFGLIKLDLKTKSENGVEFSSGIVNNQESGKVFGSLQSKYAVKDYGLTFTEKWNTDNTLATDITLADKIAVGLKVTLEGTFAPQTGSKTGKLKSSYVTDLAAFNVNADLDLNGPIVDAAAVLHHQGWLAGVFTQFDTQKTKFSKNNFALGYQSKDFALHTNVDNGKDFGGSIYQKVSDKLECGVSMKWSAGSSDTLFGVGSKFLLDSDASLHAKINNKSLIGLGYQQKLRQGVTLTLSAAIDGQNFNAGGHKIGLALELEP